MFRILSVFLFSLELLMAVEILSLGNNDSYEALPYSMYSVVENMDDVPSNLAKNIWYKDKSKLERNPEHEAYWIRVKVKNVENVLKELYLLDERRYIYFLEYYLVKNSEVSTYRKDGFYIKENSSSFNASQRIFPLTLAPYEEAEIFFKVQNYNMLDMPFRIVTKNYLIEYFQLYSFLQGAFFIVLLVMVVYNLMIYFIVKVRVYLYYLAYVLLLIVYQAGYFGYLKVLGVSPLVILFFMIAGGVGFIVFAALFIKTLFQLKKYLPKIDKMFSLVIGYLIFIMLIYLASIVIVDFYASQFMFNMISLAIPLYVFILLYALNYLAYKQVNNVVYAYSIIWNIIAVLGLLLIAMHSNLISTDLGIDYLFEFGMLVETVFFSLLLAYRLKEVEREKQEQALMLVQQNKLASMGEMINNIAHQWRQPLTQINGTALVLEVDYYKKCLTEERLEEHISDIENTTTYMSETINDFLNFFKTKKELSHFLALSLIEESRRIIMMSSSNKVKIISDVDDTLLVGYKSELIQVLLIVINNAIDAYSGDERATVIITIKDNGTGISDEVLTQMFEPYYTTKHKDQGTGLGLYILKMIIENGMGGHASIKNDVNGAIFTIDIPRVMT